jgi:hypothetical protein
MNVIFDGLEASAGDGLAVFFSFKKLRIFLTVTSIAPVFLYPRKGSPVANCMYQKLTCTNNSLRSCLSLILTFEAALNKRLDGVLVHVLLPRPRVVHKIVRERFIRADPGLQDKSVILKLQSEEKITKSKVRNYVGSSFADTEC